jgi:hypothetical protein
MAPLEDILQIDPSLPKQQRLLMLDRLYVELRAYLMWEPQWLHGPLWVHEAAADAFGYLSRYSPIEGRVYLHWGSGVEHPFGVTSIFLLNGAKGCFSVEPDTPAPERVAISLFDLLLDCMIQPAHWLWTSTPEKEFLNRILLFHLSELKNGDIQSGLQGIPLQFQASELSTCSIPDSVVHLASSRNMINRSKNPEADMKKLFDILAPGGLVYHLTDLADPRRLNEPERFHAWSFLTEKDDWPEAPVHDLRCSEWEALFLETGFEILNCRPEREALPADIRPKLKQRFANLTDDELSVISARWILAKPIG